LCAPLDLASEQSLDAYSDETSDRSQRQSDAQRVLSRHPNLRDQALKSPSFQAWKNTYRELFDDGQRWFVRIGIPMRTGGDRLLDLDELLLAWARSSDAPEAALIRALFER
jgi:hypothetical protein